MLLSMLLVSIMVFAVVEIAPGNVARNILGTYATPEQEASMAKQLGLTRPAAIRYISWLFGSDWQASRQIGMSVREIVSTQGLVENAKEWWALDENGDLVQWEVVDDKLYKLIRQPDESTIRILDEDAWNTDENGQVYFWGVDSANRAAKWLKGEGGVEFRYEYTG